MVNQFMHDPRVRNLQTVGHVLQYIKATSRRGLLFKINSTPTLKDYTNFYYAGSSTKDLFQDILLSCVQTLLIREVKSKSEVAR